MGRRESKDRRSRVSSISGEKRELAIASGNWGVMNTIMKSNVILRLY